MEPLQQSINFFFFIIIYVPFNVVLMIITTLGFRVLNRIFQLNFPIWALGLSAGVLVFVMMYAYLDSVSHKSGWVNFHNDDKWLLKATLIINAVVLVIMLVLMIFTKLIVKNQETIAFVFEKPQMIASGIYTGVLLLFMVFPIINAGKAYATDIRTENYQNKLKAIIARNDTKAFEKEVDGVYGLWKITLKGNNGESLLDFLVSENKIDLVEILLKTNKSIIEYHQNLAIKSVEMMDVLVKNGMSPNNIIQILTNQNQRDLIPIAVQKFHPDFSSQVAIITMNVVQLNDAGMMDYLVANGLTNHLDQTNEAINYFAEKDNFEAIKVLIDRGFKLDPSDSRLIYWAIYNSNLDLLKYFFQYPFDVNKRSDEYTHLENAIISGHDEIVDFLLTQKPDIHTLHYTKLNGNTNALLIAEKYKRIEILRKLKSLH